MTQTAGQDEVVFTTKWFDLVARRINGSIDPPHLINSPDFLVITALNAQRELLLVRQVRPAISGLSLELFSGHVEPGEMPEAAARRELLKETGHEAGDMELLSTLAPTIGRYINKMWCYFAPKARSAEAGSFIPEVGVELVRYGGKITSFLEAEGF